MPIPIYQVDAFTTQLFRGNPAAVCLLEQSLPDSLLQSIALENQLSETAFLWRQTRSRYSLRWFTPAAEVDLCGHATLASARVLFDLHTDLEALQFETASGLLTVERCDSEGTMEMQFPAKTMQRTPLDDVVAALGIPAEEVVETWATDRDAVVVVREESQVLAVTPEFERLCRCRYLGNIVTSRGGDVDFVSRFFAPRLAVPEDPVTGSAHCALGPYWSGVLGRPRLRARQLSTRGGELEVECSGERVLLRGCAVVYLHGSLSLPSDST